MKIFCTINTYGERTPQGYLPLKNDLKIELSNKYNGYAEMKIKDEVFLININELNKALDCVNYEYSYRCGELN